MQFTIETRRLEHEGDVTYRASISELDLDAYGLTEHAAIARLDEVLRVELEHRRRLGQAVPTPGILSGLLHVGLATDLQEHSLTGMPSPRIISQTTTPASSGDIAGLAVNISSLHLALTA